jgi:EAL domain-containing protein (putative c-di-GMP-specific phosphodiesterase class I)/AmiR/NasT family two-component response regulator
MPENGTPVRVLLADDNVAVREVLTQILAQDVSLDLVAAVGDAAQAIELAVQHRPDVALIDVRMPGGGVHATREICRRVPETAVVALSAADDRTTVLRMLESGALGYLVKGSDAGELIETIKRSARHQSSLSAQVAGHIVDELARKLRNEEAEASEVRQVTDRVTRALENGELAIAFQPIVSLRSGELAGYEALARFDLEPAQAPDRWFADAESVGLRLKLELAAIERALAALPHLESHAYLALNVSPATVLEGSLEDLVPRVDRPRIVLEVTEHAPIESYEALAQALAPLRADGVRLAVDDAGAGFASLRHILKLAPDLIKIDQSLTKDIEHDPRVRALAAAIITFARETGVAVVAEGVETPTQLEQLRALGATCAQGYLLGRPTRRPVQVEAKPSR